MGIKTISLKDEAYKRLKAARRYPDESTIARPERWGGFRITAEVVEFWEEKPDRIHDRIRYRRSGQLWEIERLSP